MRTRVFVLLACLIVVSAFCGEALAQNLGVEVCTDKDVYVLGQDTLVLSVSGYNDGPGVYVDVHIALGTPDGSIYEVPCWDTNFTPILANVFLPQGFFFPMTELCSYAVGNSSLPATEPGQYWFAAAFTRPGTLDFLALSLVWFHGWDSNYESSGTAKISWTKWYDDDYGWEVHVWAYAEFGGYKDPLPYAWPDGVLGLPLDSCKVWVYSDDGYPSGYLHLDAGETIDLFGSPVGSLRLTKYSSRWDEWYEPERHLDLEDYSAGANYRFIGHGGPDIGPFEVSVVAPPALAVYKPALNQDTVINREHDYTVQWDGQEASDVLLSMTGRRFDYGARACDAYDCWCRCRDDGQFTIPQEVLAQIPLGEWPDGSFFTIERWNGAEFNASGLTDGGYAVALASVQGHITVE